MNYLRAANNWGKVSIRAAFYGTIGTTLGFFPGMRPVMHWCMHQWCQGCADALKIKRTLIHGERIHATGQGVFIANHLSSLDILVLGFFLDRDFRWLAKSELFNVPFSGWYLRNAGHIPSIEGVMPRHAINRSGGVSTGSLTKARVYSFPEGTRSENGELREFRMGAFTAAINEDLPIIPLVIRGTHELMASGAADLLSGKIEVVP